MIRGPVWADRVVLENGDTLTGKAVSLKKGKVTFQSDILGSLDIPVVKIKSLETDGAIKVTVKEGQKPTLMRIRASEKGVVLEQEGRKREISLKDIWSFGAATEPSEAEKVKPKKVKWSGKLEAGLAGRTGNTDRIQTQGGIKITATHPNWTLANYLNARYAEQEIRKRKIRTDNEIRGGTRFQWIIKHRLSGYVSADLERDEREELSLRSLLNGGLAIWWLKDKQWFYENRFGYGYQHERWDNGNTRESCVANFTSDFRYKVNSHIEITQATTWIPNFDDQDDYRINAESAATFYLDKEHHLFLKSGLRHMYDNKVPENVEHLDMYYFTNLGYKF